MFLPGCGIERILALGSYGFRYVVVKFKSWGLGFRCRVEYFASVLGFRTNSQFRDHEKRSYARHIPATDVIGTAMQR